MNGRGDKEQPAGPGRGRAQAREARQAEALRENLKRRKAQARLRREAGGEGASSAKHKAAGSAKHKAAGNRSA